MKAVIRWTLQQRRWFTFWWSVGITATVAIQLAFYPSFKSQFAELNKTLDQLPAGVKGLIGDSGGSYFSPETYLNSRVFYLVMPILLAILFISVGSKLLAREEKNGTIELLLSRPISRGRLLAGKALSGLAITGIATTVSLIVCVLLSQAVDIPNTSAQITMAMLLTYLLGLVYGSFAFMLTAGGGKLAHAATGLSIFIFMAGYILNGLKEAVTWLEGPAKLFPYHYFKPQEMLSGNYNWAALVGYSLASILFAIIAYVSFRRRDLA